jgi:glycolate oxidase FAD binding subunit
MHTPRSEAELASLVRETKTPLAIEGGGTRGVAITGARLSLSALTGIQLYEPGALTMVASAGTPVAQIEAALAEHNQRLAFEPADHRALMGTGGAPTIGGVMAANVSGPRRISAGAARDFLLGVRFVDGTGTTVKNGGRVMKNVTGYDLVKLMAGAHGTLGVLSEVSFKVLPRPETQATLVLHGLDNAAAVGALAQALGSPFEVSGAAHDPASGQTMLRVEGFAHSVRYRSQALRDMLHCEATIEESSETRWADWRDLRAFSGTDGDVWRISCKPSDGPVLAAKAAALAVMYDWAGGLVWLRTPAGYDLRGALGAFGGHATLVRGTGQPRFHPEAVGVARIAAGLRVRFDPRGVLNRGLMA